MSEYAISGIWKDNDKITDYAFHKYDNGTIYYGEKTDREDAVEIVDNKKNKVFTIIWNYDKKTWEMGQPVKVRGTGFNSYLATVANDKVIDNLENLIDYGFGGE